MSLASGNDSSGTPSTPFPALYSTSRPPASGSASYAGSAGSMTTGMTTDSPTLSPLATRPASGSAITGTAASFSISSPPSSGNATTYPQYATLSSTITTSILNAQSSPVTVQIGPGGVAGVPFNQTAGAPVLLEPTPLPENLGASSSGTFSGGPSAVIPSGGTVVVTTIGTQIISQTFVPTLFSQYATLSSTITTSLFDGSSSPATILVGPGGIAWVPLGQPTGEPGLPPPLVLPSNSNASMSGHPTSTDTNTPSTGSQSATTRGSVTPVPSTIGSTNQATPTAPPSSSSSSTLPLIITSYNPDAETLTTLPPTITGNTVLYTSDASHTVGYYPLVKGGSSCFFCPPGINLGGLVLFGMQLPGIYPPPFPPPFPGAINFPSITVGADGKPTPGPKPDNEPTNGQPSNSASETGSSTTTATSTLVCRKTAIASDCSVICSTASASSTQTCTTTCFSTVTGCSATGTTFTSIETGACELPASISNVGTADPPDLLQLYPDLVDNGGFSTVPSLSFTGTGAGGSFNGSLSTAAQAGSGSGTLSTASQTGSAGAPTIAPGSTGSATSPTSTAPLSVSSGSLTITTTTDSSSVVPSSSCSLVITTETGTIAPGPQTYCTCGAATVGLNTLTTSGVVYSVCAGSSYTVGSSTLPPPTATTLPSTATTFDPSETTLSCGARYGPASVVPMAVPRDQTDYILKSIAEFCSLSGAGGDMLKLKQGKEAHKSYRLEKPSTGAFQLAVTWDPRPECSGIPAPVIRKATPAGPDYWCNTRLGQITNGCDAQAGQDKNGGTLESNCVIYAWVAFDASTFTKGSLSKIMPDLLARREASSDGSKVEAEKYIRGNLSNHNRLRDMYRKSSRRNVLKASTTALAHYYEWGVTLIKARALHSDSWNTYAPKGIRYWNEFNSRPAGQADRPPRCNFFTEYNDRSVNLARPPRPMMDLFTRQGIGIGNNYYNYVTTWPLEHLGKITAGFINVHSPADGVIIASDNRRQPDPNPDDIPKNPDTWSEIAWWQWMRACNTVKPGQNAYGDLKYIFRYHIENPSGSEIIVEALGNPMAQDKVVTFVPDADQSLDNAFWPLLGSENGNGIIHMLADHKQTLGGKTVKSLNIYYNSNSVQYYMWAVIG